MENPFKVGFEVPPEFDEMYSAYSFFDECPPYLDNGDYISYGVRGHVVENEEVSERLFEQYRTFLSKTR